MSYMVQIHLFQETITESITHGDFKVKYFFYSFNLNIFMH